LQAEALSALEPAQLREILPTFLAGFVQPDDVAAHNQKRMTELLAGWPDRTLKQVQHHVASLGAEHRLYTADPTCRIIRAITALRFASIHSIRS